MTELHIGAVEFGDGNSHPVAINLDDYEEQGLRVGIFAASGSGKGYLLGVLLEEFIDNGFPIVAIDPESELWTFQEMGALVLGGPHGDVPLPRTDEAVRKAIEFGVTFNTPIIFDLGGIRGAANLLREGERISSIFWDYADGARSRIVFAATEAEVFAPQQVPARGPQPEMLATMSKRGRKRGVITLLETQRVADIANSVITQCNVRFIGRMDDTADYDRIKRYVAPMTFAEMRALPTGTFELTGRDGARVSVRERRTTHGGGTPVGGAITIRERPSTEALAQIVEALQTPEVEAELPQTAAEVKAAGHSVAGMVARADFDRVEQHAQRQSAAAEQALKERDAVRAELRAAEERERERTARIGALEHQVHELRPLAQAASSIREGLIALVGEQVVTAQINMPDGTTFSGYDTRGLDEEAVIALIRAHAPAGGAAGPALLPVEALRARYLEQAAQRLVAAVEGLDETEREVLLFLIGRPVFHTINGVQKALTGSDGGTGRKKYEEALLGLVQKGLVKVGGSGRSGRMTDVDGWVERGLTGHQPSPEEIEQVKNRALSVVMAR